jgi:hypothetical protein
VSYITLPSSGGISSVSTDGITLTGDGVATDIEILQVQTDATITGDGTVASPLSAVGGGSSLGFAFVERTDNTIGSLVVPFLAFPALDNPDYTLQMNEGAIMDIAGGGIRFLVAGTYLVRCQMTWRLDELQPSNSEFILTSGLTLNIDPNPTPVINGSIHANIESNTEWTHTVQYEFLYEAKGMDSLFPYVETIGDPLSISMDGGRQNTNWTITQVKA